MADAGTMDPQPTSRSSGAQLVNSIYMLKNVLDRESRRHHRQLDAKRHARLPDFELTLGVKQPAARQYMRCYERFADNVEAIRSV